MELNDKVDLLEKRYQKLENNIDTLTNAIHHLSTIALIFFLLGMIAGFLI